MRFLKLKIDNYKVLDNLEINFSPKYSTTIIIGKNGTGKTTIVECLTEIFSNLLKVKDVADLQKLKFPFDFEIAYLLRKEKSIETSFYGESYVDYIGVEYKYKGGSLTILLHYADKIFENVKEISKFLRNQGESIKYILPDNIILYYSGISEIIYNKFHDFQDEIILGSLDGETKVDQPFFYFLPENLSSILTGLLSFEFGDVPNILLDKFGISGFNEIRIIVKKPSWAKSKSTAEDFWGAKGDLSIFLERLKSNSSLTSIENDRLVFFINSTNQLSNIWSYYGSEKRLFEYLVSLQANGLIEDIEIDLFKNNLSMNHNRLSEGEKQLLIIIGLKELLAADNSLFILDEPDTFLHPEWKRDFIYSFLTEDSELVDKNFYIVTTHSPNVISGLKREQLKILENNNGKSNLRDFTFNPYGQRVDKILLDFFSVDGLRFKKIEQDITKLKKLVLENNYNSEEFIDLYKKLEKEVGKSDVELLQIKLEVAKRMKDEGSK